jgi:peptidoglycan hydrolase CwlO-like protein
MRNRKKLTSVMAGIMAVIVLLSLVLTMIPVARAASSDEIRGQINDMKAQQNMIRQEMNALREQYQKNENEIVDLVSRKLLLDQEIFLLNAQISVINDQISAFALLIADKQDELDEARIHFRELNEAYKDRIRIMEEEGAMSYWEVIFRASSFADLIDRLNMIQEIAAADRRRLEALTDAADQVSRAKSELETEMADMEATRRELDETNAELQVKKQEAEDTIAELKLKSAEIEALYGDIEAEESALLLELKSTTLRALATIRDQLLLHHLRLRATIPRV